MPEIITRAEAKARGLKRYFTGEPCKHGHFSERLMCQSCVECDRQRYLENRDHWKKKAAAWWRAHPEQRLLKKREYYARNRERVIQRRKEYQKQYNERRRRNNSLARRDDCLECGTSLKEIPGARTLCSAQCRKLRRKNQLLEKRRSSVWNNKHKKSCRDYYWRHREKLRKLYEAGQPNPKGELQWLRKNQALLRSLKRVLRYPNRDHSHLLNAGPKL